MPGRPGWCGGPGRSRGSRPRAGEQMRFRAAAGARDDDLERLGPPRPPARQRPPEGDVGPVGVQFLRHLRGDVDLVIGAFVTIGVQGHRRLPPAWLRLPRAALAEMSGCMRSWLMAGTLLLSYRRPRDYLGRWLFANSDRGAGSSPWGWGVAKLRINDIPASAGQGRRVEVTWEDGRAAPRVAVAELGDAPGEGDRERIRWYLEDYAEFPADPAPALAAAAEARLAQAGEDLFRQVFSSADAAGIWERARDQLSEIRVEVDTDPGAGPGLAWEVLRAAHAAGRPYHVVHFDGHGSYLDLTGLGFKPDGGGGGGALLLNPQMYG